MGTNTGSVISWNEDGYICVGFECSKCKKTDPKSIVKLSESEFLNVRNQQYSRNLDPLFDER